MRALRAFPLIAGIRSQQGMDTDLLADMLIRVALLVTGFPVIRKMDLNPVKGHGAALCCVDARITTCAPSHLPFRLASA